MSAPSAAPVAPEDAADLAAVRSRGDPRAFGRLYDRHTPYLYRFALRLAGGESGDAEELVHDTWVRAVERAGSFEGRSSLRTWLGGILAFRAREQWNRAARVMLDVADVPVAVSDAALEAALDRVDLERGLAALPPGARQVFVLHDVEGYTHGDIAERLGIEPGTSKSQLSRARALLRARLGGRDGARP